MNVSLRQEKRIRKRYIESGVKGLLLKREDKSSNNKISEKKEMKP